MQSNDKKNMPLDDLYTELVVAIGEEKKLNKSLGLSGGLPNLGMQKGAHSIEFAKNWVSNCIEEIQPKLLYATLGAIGVSGATRVFDDDFSFHIIGAVLESTSFSENRDTISWILIKSGYWRRFFESHFESLIEEGTIQPDNSAGGKPPTPLDDGNLKQLLTEAFGRELSASELEDELKKARLVLSYAAASGLTTPMGSQQGRRTDLKGSQEAQADGETSNLCAAVPKGEAAEINAFLKSQQLKRLDLVRAGYAFLKMLRP